MPLLANPLPLGVVPVFVNAGAALLPALVAGVASVVSLLLRPGELWQACRARPRLAGGVVAGLLLLGVGLGWAFRSPSVSGERRPTSVAADVSSRGLPHVDWAAQALAWIREERLAAVRISQPAPGPANEPARRGAAWIMGGSPLRNGYAGGDSPRELMPLWEFPATADGDPAAVAASNTGKVDLDGAMFLASPAVVGDAVYAASCLVDAFRNYGTLACLDAATGKPRWTISVFRDASGTERQFKGFFSSPAVSADGNYVVVGQGLHTDENCDLVCLNARNGRVAWRVTTPLHIESSPALEGDLAVVGAGAIEEGSEHHVKGHPGLVLAVRVSTGEKLWEHPLADPESSPVVCGGVVYIGSGFNGSEMVALRSESDEELQRKGVRREMWRVPTPHPATGAVTVTDELVLVGCGNGDYVFANPTPDGALLALDRATGRLRWQLPMPDAVLGRVAVHGLRAIAPVRNGELVAIDLAPSASERVLWRQRINATKAILAGPAFTGSHVYALSHDGQLAVLDAADGKVLEKHSLNAQGKPGVNGLCISSPTVAAGRVFVGSETGGLRCFAGTLPSSGQ